VAVIGGGSRRPEPGVRGVREEVETSAGDKSELGRIRRSRRRVTISFGRPLKLSFGPGGFWGSGGAAVSGVVVADPAGGVRHPPGPPYYNPQDGSTTCFHEDEYLYLAVGIADRLAGEEVFRLDVVTGQAE
jgi:hypothetical protein